MYVPHLIRTVWQSRSAAAEAAIMRPDDPLDVSYSSRVFGSVTGTVVFWATLYILLSMSLTKYNKWLITPGRFPFALNFCIFTNCCGSVYMLVLLKVMPQLYPSMHNSARNTTLSQSTLLSRLLPIVMCIGASLVLTNSAFVYASVTFLQMMKGGDLVVVYVLSLLAGLEVFHGVRSRVLFCLLMSTALTVQGEVYFSATAFFVQASSQFADGSKVVLQGLLMSAASSYRIDPYTFNLLAQPMVATLLLVFLGVCVAFIPSIPTASLPDVLVWSPYLFFGGSMGVCLNVTSCNLIACASPVTFVLCCILKGVAIVLVDVLLSGTHISVLQVVSFALQLLFIAWYSFLKIYQKELDRESTEYKSKSSALAK
jgi:hypothetical protein